MRYWKQFLTSLVSSAVLFSGTTSANTCDSDFEEHGVFDTTVVYLIDEVVDGPIFLPMDPDRNTLAYRQFAYDFFAEHYGMEFDVNIPGIQQIFDGEGGVAEVFPLKTGVGSTHQVYGIDAQDIPQWRHKLPLTKVAFFDDGFFVTILSDFQVHGEYGGAAGVVVPAFTQMVAGEYRMFDDKENLLETFIYRARIPVPSVPVGGVAAKANGAIDVNIKCDIESELFGDGQVRALGEITPLADGSTDLVFRYVMTFPARLADTTVTDPKCKEIKPLN